MSLGAVVWTWIQFSVLLLVIGWAGVKLSRYGDIIAEKTNMGGTWVGLVLLATVTSLPELVTGISSVTVAHVPNIAVGDALGSCVFNLLILVVVDFFYRKESVYTRARQGHILSAGFGIVLIGMVAANLVLAQHGFGITFHNIGFYTPIIFLFYILAMRTVFHYEQAHLDAYTEESIKRYPEVTMQQAVMHYAAVATLVVVAASYLPFVGNALAVQMGWHKSFVGTIFIAFATSVPELVVTIAAVRIGALDMAVANLFGSNLFDALIIGIDDVFYREGSLLADASPVHTMTAVSAMVMTGIAIIGLLYRPTGRVLKTVGWTSLALFSIYLLNTLVLFLYGE